MKIDNSHQHLEAFDAHELLIFAARYCYGRKTIAAGACARELAEVLHPHPAVTEGLQECVRMLLGTSIYKPHVFRNELRLSQIDYVDPEKAHS